MLKKTIVYNDFNGVERKEDFYFNLTEEEIITSEITTPGGLRNYLQQIIDAKDGGAIMTYMREFIRMSYGEKSPDGRRFVKSPELSKAFMETQAYNKLFMELVASENAAEKAADFVNAIMPNVPDQPQGDTANAITMNNQ
jgi:hypothetical protein